MPDEKEFKTQYIATFLATWTAVHYDDACMRSQHEMLREPPIEDAEHLADCAWQRGKEILGWG